MDFEQIYHFIFETYAGMGILIGATLIICVIVAAVLEIRTRSRYKDRGERTETDEWSLFDDDDNDDDNDDDGNSEDDEGKQEKEDDAS